MEKKTKPITIRMSEDLYKYVVEQSKAENKSQKQFIEEVLERHLKGNNGNYADEIAKKVVEKLKS